MELEDRQDWSVYKQIFADHRDGFKEEHHLYDKEYYNDLVEKMLSCGNPRQMGYIEYRCVSCGRGGRVLSMSCKE
jgi:hypothetical protein